jgi:deoxyribonuclease V
VLDNIPNLDAELRTLLYQIPAGRVATYGDLAAALGNAAAARWVGEYLLDHEHDSECPCHRVIRSNGDVGLSITGDPADKIGKLQAEGVDVSAGRIPLGEFGFSDFQSNRPLRQLDELQIRIAEQVSLAPLASEPECVAGVDVSYVDRDWAVAAYALVDVADSRLVWSTTVRSPVSFPYIPGYLTFREVPALLDLLEQVRSEGRLTDLILVDGTGILHPRSAGIATHFGVVAGISTVGVSKKLLRGRVDLAAVEVDAPAPITYRGQVQGMAVKGRPRYKPVFVCPGHSIDVAGAVKIVQRLFRGHRLPEPTYWADALSRQAARAAREELQ